MFCQLNAARFYDANHGRLDSTISQLHNHINLALAAKECFQTFVPQRLYVLYHVNYMLSLRFETC